MSNSPNLQLPYIDANQSQKHVTHNQAVRMLDVLVDCAVTSQTITTPPGSPTDGQAWIVGVGATGAWSGKDLNIAAWQDGAWVFYPPKRGMTAFDIASGTLIVYGGSSWLTAGASSALQNLTLLGIGTTADGTNPLSAKLNNILFTAKTSAESGDGDLRFKLNKETSGDTVSQLYQTGFSGRAETGLIGTDHYAIKVSPDGSAWVVAVDLDPTTGMAKLAALALPKASLTVANGLNSNLTTPAAALLRLAGATAAFSIGGLTGGSDGRVVKLFNPLPQTMTIVNDDASSTAANRITTLTGANIVLRSGAPSFATLSYDATNARWIVESVN